MRQVVAGHVTGLFHCSRARLRAPGGSLSAQRSQSARLDSLLTFSNLSVANSKPEPTSSSRIIPSLASSSRRFEPRSFLRAMRVRRMIMAHRAIALMWVDGGFSSGLRGAVRMAHRGSTFALSLD